MSRTVSMQFGNPTSVDKSFRNLKWDLVWENESPTSSFSAQTVSINLSGYMTVAVLFRITTSSDTGWMQFGFMGYSGNYGGAMRGASYTYHREFSISSTGITFANGYRDSTSGSGYAIPVRIWATSISAGGGGGGGTPVTVTDYSSLTNKPQIESVTLNGNISLSQLGVRNIYYDTTTNWNANPTLVSKAGALYIYSDCQVDYDQDETTTTIAGVKIGDGSAYVIDLPFITDPLGDALIAHVNDTSKHVTSSERAAWNNKVSAFISSTNPEELVLSKVLFEANGLIIST